MKKGVCLIMFLTKALLGPKATENYCVFQPEILLNNAMLFSNLCLFFARTESALHK